jgi:hypothetical protein
MMCGAVATAIAVLPLWTAIEHQPTDLTTVGLAIGLGFGLLSAVNSSFLDQFLGPDGPKRSPTSCAQDINA